MDTGKHAGQNHERRTTMKKTTIYRTNGTTATEYLSDDIVEAMTDAWLEEAHELAYDLVTEGSISLKSLQRLRTLASRTGFTLDNYIDAGREMADDMLA